MADIKVPNLNRRRFVSGSAATVAALSASIHQRYSLAEEQAAEAGAAGAVNHSACKWCYKNVTLEELCEAGKEFGLRSVELLAPSDAPTLRKYGMDCAMITAPSAEGTVDGKKVKIGPISHAFNRVENHDILVELYEPYIKESVDAGFKNIICFSGNRRGLDDEAGIENCAKGLQRLMPLCEKLGATLSMELLNSKVNHKDYQCDHTEWGVELCKKVGSDKFKLLYDIYHMQIMEGDVIATIKKNNEYISHYHTGGVPGRAEIDETQELYYPAIIRAILDTGYKGWVGQEFIPKRPDKIASLKQGVEICTV